MKRYGDRDWYEADDYPGRAIVFSLIPEEIPYPGAEPMSESKSHHPDHGALTAGDLPYTRKQLEDALVAVPLVAAAAVSSAGDDPGGQARVCHAIKKMSELSAALDKVCKEALGVARERLLNVMSDAGQPSVIVETPDGKRRLSSVSQPGYPTLRNPEQRDDATAALSACKETAHLVVSKYDTREMRSWATKAAVDEDGVFHLEQLPQAVLAHFEFPTKVGVSDNKA